MPFNSRFRNNYALRTFPVYLSGLDVTCGDFHSGRIRTFCLDEITTNLSIAQSGKLRRLTIECLLADSKLLRELINRSTRLGPIEGKCDLLIRDFRFLSVRLLLRNDGQILTRFSHLQ